MCRAEALAVHCVGSASWFSCQSVSGRKKENVLVFCPVPGRGLNLLTPLRAKSFLNHAGFNPQPNYPGLFESMHCSQPQPGVSPLPRSTNPTPVSSRPSTLNATGDDVRSDGSRAGKAILQVSPRELLTQVVHSFFG